ncbi:MAG: radical SAM protein [Bifidobacteriaceae bacterium]|nr:radical SAM protein [Bifidobacteriaceae bacterium]
MSLSVAVNRILAPITALGPGRRLGLWVQGCALRCEGCASRDTWDPSGGRLMPTEELAAELNRLIELHELDGLTLTGGEPFDQAEALAETLRLLRLRPAPSERSDSAPEIPGESKASLDVLAFTGYTASAAKRKAGALWEMLDAVVAGPYRQDLPSDEPLIASSNQQLIRLNPDWEPGPARRMQVMTVDGELVLAGLPRPGDLDRLEAELARRGVVLGGLSWRD